MQISHRWLVVAASLLCASAWAQPAPIDKEPPDRWRRPLDAAQLRSIQQLGQAVSAAHNGQRDGTADPQQISALKASIGEAFASEIGADQLDRPEQQGDSASRKGAAREGAEARAAKREANRRKAHEFIARMRTQAEASASKTVDGGAITPVAALAKNRAAMFKRWANQIDEAQGGDPQDRLKVLGQLQQSLELSPIAPADKGYVNNTPSVSMVRHVPVGER